MVANITANGWGGLWSLAQIRAEQSLWEQHLQHLDKLFRFKAGLRAYTEQFLKTPWNAIKQRLEHLDLTHDNHRLFAALEECREAAGQPDESASNLETNILDGLKEAISGYGLPFRLETAVDGFALKYAGPTAVSDGTARNDYSVDLALAVSDVMNHGVLRKLFGEYFVQDFAELLSRRDLLFSKDGRLLAAGEGEGGSPYARKEPSVRGQSMGAELGPAPPDASPGSKRLSPEEIAKREAEAKKEGRLRRVEEYRKRRKAEEEAKRAEAETAKAQFPHTMKEVQDKLGQPVVPAMLPMTAPPQVPAVGAPAPQVPTWRTSKTESGASPLIPAVGAEVPAASEPPAQPQAPLTRQQQGLARAMGETLGGLERKLTAPATAQQGQSREIQTGLGHLEQQGALEGGGIKIEPQKLVPHGGFLVADCQLIYNQDSTLMKKFGFGAEGDASRAAMADGTDAARKDASAVKADYKIHKDPDKGTTQIRVDGQFTHLVLEYYGTPPFLLPGDKDGRLRNRLAKELMQAETKSQARKNTLRAWDGAVDAVAEFAEDVGHIVYGLEDRLNTRKRRIKQGAVAVGAAALMLLAAMGGALSPKKPSDYKPPATEKNKNAPYFVGAADHLEGMVDEPFSHVFAAADGDGDDLEFGFGTPLPPWLSINKTNGLLSGIPVMPGTFPLNISVTDGKHIAYKELGLLVGKPIGNGHNGNGNNTGNLTNLPPILDDVQIVKIGRDLYRIVGTARDAANDSEKGSIFDILVGGNVVKSVRAYNLSETLNLSELNLLNVTDYILQIYAKDIKDPTLRSRLIEQTLQRAGIPLAKLDVVAKGNDQFDASINVSADERIDEVNLYVEGQQVGQWNPAVAEFTQTKSLDLKAYAGSVNISLEAKLATGDRLANATQVEAVNDPTTLSVGWTPSDSAEANAWDYSVNWSDADTSQVKLTVSSSLPNASAVKDVTGKTGTSNGRINAANVLPGEYDIAFSIEDRDGVKAEKNYQLHVLNDNSSVVLSVAPQSDPNLIKVRAYGSDADTAFRLYTRVGAPNFIDVKATDFAKTQNVSYDYNFSANLPGDGKVTVNVVDEVGAEYVLSAGFQIPNDDPTINITSRFNPLEDRLNETLNITDPDTAIKEARYELYNKTTNQVVLQDLINITPGKIIDRKKFLINTTGLPEGQYGLRVFAKDELNVTKMKDVPVAINRSIGEIVPVWNPDVNATAGQLRWNDETGKAELLLIGNNTWAKNWEDDWADVQNRSPELYDVIINNVSDTIDNCPDEVRAGANWVNSIVRSYSVGRPGVTSSENDGNNMTSKDFAAAFDYVKNIKIKNGKANWERAFALPLEYRFGTAHRLFQIFNYDANNNGVFEGDEQDYADRWSDFDSAGNYESRKIGTFITEFQEYKNNHGFGAAKNAAWQALNYWWRTNISVDGIEADESTLIQLMNDLDKSIGSALIQLNVVGQAAETYLRLAGSGGKVKITYNTNSESYVFNAA